MRGSSQIKSCRIFRDKLHGNGAFGIAVVTFGNRAYDHSLAELCSVMAENGFRTVAAGAFVGQHAFTDKFAAGRPNWSDQAEIKDFAKRIVEKFNCLTEPVTPITVPGDAAAPYYVPKGTDGLPAKFLKAKPKTDPAKCSSCGACARVDAPWGLLTLMMYSAFREPALSASAASAGVRDTPNILTIQRSYLM